MKQPIFILLTMLCVHDVNCQNQGSNCFIGVGTNEGNRIPAGTKNAGIVAGATNTNGGNFAFLGAGRRNTINVGSSNSVIVGGLSNTIASNSVEAVVVGGSSNSASGIGATVGGGTGNKAGIFYSTISGGYYNQAYGGYSSVGGGLGNIASGLCTIGGGMYNKAEGLNPATVAGGFTNSAIGPSTTVGGGEFNKAIAATSTVSGGENNTASGAGSTVGGGSKNTASGTLSTVPGGAYCYATNAGSFVWSADTNVATSSWGDRTFTVRARGGVRFYTSTNNTGVSLAPNGTQWQSLSDRNSKTNFRIIDKKGILEKVASMSITSWEYIGDPSRRYIGPTAQDFYAAFGLGNDDKTIGTLDSDGVMYAAIQGLVENLKERDHEIDNLKNQMEEIKKRVDSLSPPAKK